MSRRIIVLLVVVAGAVGALWWWHARREVAPWRPALSSREIATRVLAEHLVQRFPLAKVMVVGNPFVQRPDQSPEIYAFEKASIRGLERGFGSRDRFQVAYPELRAGFLDHPEAVFVDPKTTTPLSFLVADNAFDHLTQANPGFPLLVSLIGLPLNLRESKLWREPASIRLALILPDWRVLGSREAVREALKSEKIVAAVMSRPGNRSDEATLEKDYKAEFNRQFLLVTKENIDELLRTFPQLF